MGWGGTRVVLLVVAVAASIAPAGAQVTPLDIFGGLLGAAQAQAACEAWARLSNTDRFCLDRALARRNTDIASLIQRGIGPDEGRLSGSFAECRRFTEPNLRRGFTCSSPDENGWSVSTTCKQTFACRDGNDQVRSVEPREAIELHFSGTRIVVAEVRRARRANCAKRRRRAGPSSSNCSRRRWRTTSATPRRSCASRPRGSRAGSSSSSPPVPVPPPPTPARSRFLIEDGRGDLIVLYNDSGKAPSVVRNLRGELVFEDGRGAACLDHAPLPDVFLNRQIRDRSAGLGAKLDLPLKPCGPNDLARQDLIFAERERLLREPVDRVITLVEAVNGNLFARLAIVDAAALASVRQAEATRADAVEAQVRERKGEGRGEGFGVVVVANGSSVLCRVAPESPEAHAAILARLSDRIGDELPGQPVFAPTSTDGAFIAVKRGECGAVYAGAADLAAITEAMTRDGLGYRFLPLWIEPSEVAGTQAEIDAGKTRSAEEQFKRQRELEDRRRLDREKEREESARRETRERALRAQYGERARFFEQTLGEEARGFATGVQTAAFIERYPGLARHCQAQRADRWEFMSIETQVLDDGTALYKDRPLETALAMTRIRMRNRIKGEYQDVCYVTGFVNDAEFGVVRDPFGEVCDEAGPKLVRYKQGERFSSRWVVP